MTITDSQRLAGAPAKTSCVSLPAGSEVVGGEAEAFASTNGLAPRPDTSFLDLRIWAQCFEDAQSARIAIENRLRSGEVDPTITTAVLSSLKANEKLVGSFMRKTLKRTAPAFRSWADETDGIGDHLLARLLGATGHPAIATPHHWARGAEGGESRVLVDDPPYVRSLGQWLSYCGHGDATRKRCKGMSQEEALAMGNPRAKMIVHLMAECAMKCVGSPAADPANSEDRPQGTDRPGGASELPNTQAGSASSGQPSDNGPGSTDHTLRPKATRAKGRRRSLYRDIYDIRRIETVDRDWTPGHAHADALRIVGKAILADLYELGLKDLDSRGGATGDATSIHGAPHPGSLS